MSGKKNDQGKPRAALPIQQFPLALIEIARVLEFGARKYGEGNWREVENGMARYEDAAARHQLARFSGELKDSESSLDHEAHELCNRLMAFELKLRESPVADDSTVDDAVMIEIEVVDDDPGCRDCKFLSTNYLCLLSQVGIKTNCGIYRNVVFKTNLTVKSIERVSDKGTNPCKGCSFIGRDHQCALEKAGMNPNCSGVIYKVNEL